jgi:hypothetical protein
MFLVGASSRTASRKVLQQRRGVAATLILVEQITLTTFALGMLQE